MKHSTMARIYVFSLVAAAVTGFCPVHTLAARDSSIKTKCVRPINKTTVSLSGGALNHFGKLSIQSFTKPPLHSLRGGLLKKPPPPKPCLVGTIPAAWKTILAESGAAWQRAEAAFRVSDLGVMLCLAFLPEIILKFISNRVVNKTIRRNNPKEFEDTPYLAPIAKAVCQVGQLALLVYFGEIFIVFLSGLGVPHLADKPKLLASFVYSLYAVQLVRHVKNRVLERGFRKLTDRSQRQNSSRKLLYSRFSDFVIYFIGTLLFLDANRIDVGVAIKSLLTVGGVSSVVIGFALKEPVTEIIQGTAVLLSNKFITGDTIRLPDGTCGKVQRFEWTDVTMQGDDNSFVRIPHSQLAKTRVVNLSRMPCSQVSQTLTLPNRGTDKINQVLDDIKQEIRAACPELDEESMPFRVHWTEFIKPDSVEIMIESHFRIPRLGDKYWDNRQNVLMAVNRAVEKYNS
mmetsp:Transcript_26123/g.56585  ORF Transcript_26123/g.56585 Transcript_26123/m.56585 type:complete len:457 (-) Transcript_26123:107-1477(-)